MRGSPPLAPPLVCVEKFTLPYLTICPQHRPPGAPTPPPPAPGGTAGPWLPLRAQGSPTSQAEAPPLPCPWRHHDRLANLRRCRGPAQIARAALRGQVVIEVRVPRHVRLVDAARDGGQLDGRVLTLAERSDMEGRCGGAAQLQGLFKGITDGCQHLMLSRPRMLRVSAPGSVSPHPRKRASVASSPQAPARQCSRGRARRRLGSRIPGP